MATLEEWEQAIRSSYNQNGKQKIDLLTIKREAFQGFAAQHGLGVPEITKKLLLLEDVFDTGDEPREDHEEDL